MARKLLGRYIVADPNICHGKATFLGTRIMVWQILGQLARGESLDAIVAAWDGSVSKDAIAEAVALAKSGNTKIIQDFKKYGKGPRT